MADMDGFLGNSIVDSIKDAQRLDRQMDGLKLIGQRKINIVQQEQITNNREYIRSLETEISQLKSQIQELQSKSSSGYNLFVSDEQREAYYNNEHRQEGLDEGYRIAHQEYQNLLSRPFQEIAAQNGNFKETYEAQMELMADWMVSQKAFKELAIEFGFNAHGYTPEQVIEMGYDKDIDVLEDKNDPSHGTNAGNGSTIGPRKEKLIEKYHREKAARKAKKGS